MKTITVLTYKSLPIILFYICFSFMVKGQAVKLPDKEAVKLVRFFGKQGTILRNGSCKDCSYIVAIKLIFNADNKPIRALLSSTAPTDLQGILTEILQLPVDWDNLLRKWKKKVIILPVTFLCLKKADHILLNSKEDLSYLFHFDDGSTFDTRQPSKQLVLDNIEVITHDDIGDPDLLIDSSRLHHIKQ
ncbi:hypothetical protein [Chitinophaga polysaccharea]|uniref:hypothetical protein n=1 Tax=Chitinophaga polysaccharea TaxID=1293035 RepID=UPI00115B9E92|nr:hypothetical protein [Chitinophaga polysaccharea]